MELDNRYYEMNKYELFAEIEDYGKSLLNPKISKSLKKANKEFLNELMNFFEERFPNEGV